MKRFIRDFIYSFFLICIVAGGIEKFAIKHMENEYSYKHQYMNEHKDDISILILGHSHSSFGVNPHLLDSAFNLAQGARPLYYDVQLATEWIPKMSNLKIVIISHGYDFPWGFFNLHCFFGGDWKREIVYMYYRYMNIPFVETPYDYLLQTALFSDHFAYENFTDEPMGIDTYDSLGFVWNGKTIHESENWQQDDTVHIKDIGEDHLYRYVQEYTRQMTEISNVCYENNVRFVMVTTPCYESYLQQTNTKGMQTLYDIVDSVRLYSPVEYYNYIADEEFRSDTFYYDCSHLNYYGAEKFTLRLKKDLGL